jgi:hypothetical protein
MAGTRTQVPVIIVVAIICLGIGLAVGAGGMIYFGYHWTPQVSEVNGKGPGGPPGQGGGAPEAKGGKGKGKGEGGSSAKVQLLLLLPKLDLLATKPPALKLDAEQKKQVWEQFKGLDKKPISEEEARERLDALLKVLKDQRPALEAVGFRWPGASEKRTGPPLGLISMYTNPFKSYASQLHTLEKWAGAEANP